MKALYSNFKKYLLLTAAVLAMYSAGATTCPNAINIPSAPVTNQALVCGGANDLSSATVPVACGGASNSYKGGLEALYTFTPTTTSNYLISIAGQTWTSIFVYAGCPTSGGTCVNSVGSSTSSKSLTVSLTAGTQYYIWFDVFPDPPSPCPGTFSIAAVAPPTCPSATNIPSVPVVNQALVCSGTDVLNATSVPAVCGAASNFYKGGMEALYTFTPATSGNYDISIAGQTYTAIFVYAGCPVTGGTCVNSIGTSTSSKTLTVSLTAGTQYYIWFDVFPSPPSPCPGTFSITAAAPPPANDECAGAIPLTAGSSCSFTQYTTTAATGSVGPPAPGCASYLGSDVWFSVVVPAGGQLIFDTNAGVVTDGGMAIYSGTCGALTLIECDDDDSVNGLMPMINRSGLTPGSTIYIRFWEFGNDNNGTFSICVYSPTPPCNAPGTPSAGNVSTTSATLSWPAAAGALTYDWTSGTGASCPTGTGGNTAATSVNLNGLTPNTTYRFCVRTSTCGGGASSGYVTTTFTTAPLPNDACAGAQTITCGSTINGSTVGAASDAAVGSCAIGSGNTPGNGVWYKLVGNGAQVTASLCGSAYDTKLHVYTGSCAGLTCLVSNDDNAAACGAGSTRSQVIFNANVGTDYYILVSGFSTNTGAFSLNLTCLCGPALGAPWTVTNIGASNGGAIENVCDGTTDIKATNYGSPTNDVQTYAWQQMCGNGFIKAKLENVTNGGWGGLMFRESNAGGSKKVALRSQLNNSVVRDLRAATNGVAQQQQFPKPNAPQWLRLTRNGNVFLGETSNDGVNWDFTFSVNLVLPSCIEVGLFSQSINVNTTVTAVFSNIMGVATSPPVIPLVDGSNGNVGTQEVLSLFPNPATDEINVKMEAFYGKNVTISVQNQLGQVVLQRDIDDVQDATERIELNNMPSGIYNLTLRTAGQAPVSKQFMVGSIRP